MEKERAENEWTAEMQERVLRAALMYGSEI